MKSPVSGVNPCLWVTLVFLISSVAAQSCKVAQDEIEVTGENVYINIDDTAGAQQVISSLDILEESVTSVSFEAVKYLTVEQVEAKINFKTADAFVNYEEIEVTASFSNILEMTCADGSTRNINVVSILSLTNNHEPQFENQNNENEDSYEFKLPMPFPKGLNVNSAFGVDIRAFDVDIDNQDIDFTIEDPEGNFDVVFLSESVDNKKRYSIAIRTLRLLDLTEPTFFTITATDVYPNEDSKSTTVRVDILVDEENTTPRSPSFSSIFYQAELENPEETGIIQTHEDIQILDPPEGEITLEINAAPGNLPSFEQKFTATHVGAGLVKIELSEPLGEDELVNPVLALELLATETASGFSARTVVHISLPLEPCQPCTTSSPELSTCPTDVTCPSCPTDATCPTSSPAFTCPTSPSCPTCAPCTTTTPPPPSSISFDQEIYATTVEAGFTGELFTVKATIQNDPDGTIEYGFNANSEEIASRLEINPTTGLVTLTRAAAPGSYRFELTATYVEENAVARALGYLDVTSFGECEDDSTCFKYALITLEAPEATDVEDLIPGSQPNNPNCVFRIDDQEPLLEGWFEINASTGALKITKESDIENEAFANMEVAQVKLRLQVECNDPNLATLDASIRPHLDEAVTKQQMLVVVTLTNRNEHRPVFSQPEITVGYPAQEFARQLFPGSLLQVQATDADKGDNEKIRYRFDKLETKFIIDELTGELYPVDGEFNYKAHIMQVLALDDEGNNGALQDMITITVQIVKEDQVAVAVIQEAHVEDAESIIEELNSKLDSHSWGSFRTSYLAESSDVPTNSEKAFQGGLLLVLYAINANLAPASHDEIKNMLNGETWSWTVSNIETWENAGGWESGNGNSTDPDEGLTIAVIVLSVIVAICMLAIAAIVYFTVYRRRMPAHAGVKNRTSFSKHRESIAVEAAKRTYVNGLEPPKIPEGEMEERKKSTVKFNDEPEVIPSDEVARL